MLSIILLPSLSLIWLTLFLQLRHCVLSSHFYFYSYFNIFDVLMYEFHYKYKVAYSCNVSATLPL